MRKSLNLFTLAIVIAAVCSAAMAAETPASSAGVVNINSAAATELMLLPRVGEKAAQRIIEYRTEHGPFRKSVDLMQVKGFGAKTYEGVAPYITLEGKTTLSSKVKSPRKPRASKQQASN
jgi:competence protein ComEA